MEHPGPFTRLGGLSTMAATDVEESLGNLRYNLARGLPHVGQLQGWNDPEPKSWPVALVGGGPSLQKTKHLIHEAPTVIACGSSHDYLIEHGIVPTFAVACDPDPITQEYFQNPSQKTIYLLASHCHPGLYEHLRDYRVVTWNCYMEDPRYTEILREFQGDNWESIAGGCTVGLRSISIALMLGFKDIHFFGFDSCLQVVEGETQHHAYQYATDREKMQDLYKVMMGVDTPGERIYLCEGYQLAQAYHFKIFVGNHGSKFTAYFHGGGMLADWYDTYLASIASRSTEETINNE